MSELTLSSHRLREGAGDTSRWCREDPDDEAVVRKVSQGRGHKQSGEVQAWPGEGGAEDQMGRVRLQRKQRGCSGSRRKDRRAVKSTTKESDITL